MIGIISAPSNLGLRPPQPTSVPGCGKAPEALRGAGLHQLLRARDHGVVLPGRYVDDADPANRRIRNQEAIVDHARRLAGRIDEVLGAGEVPLVLGGDCSILLGAGIALRRRGGRGLLHLDGHTDFRHPGNSSTVASLAGEDLAAAVGLHWPAVSDIDGLGPYFDRDRVVHLGARDGDDELEEARSVIAALITAGEYRDDEARATSRAREVLSHGPFWLHLDVDILDPSHLPAVDSPDPGGLDPAQLTRLLQAFAPQAIGAQVTVFDPDLDPGGHQADLLAGILAEGLRELGAGI